MSSTQQAVRKVLLLIAYYRRGNRREEMKWLAQSHTDRTRSAHRTGHRVRSTKVFIPNTANPLTFLFFRGILALLLFHLCFKISFQFSWKKKNPIGMNWNCTESAVQWGENDIFLASNFLFVNTCSLSICLDRIQCLSIRFYNFLL